MKVAPLQKWKIFCFQDEPVPVISAPFHICHRLRKQLELNHVRIVSVPFVNWDKVKTVESSPEYRQSLEGLIQELRRGSGRSEAVSVEDVERRDRVREELSRHGLEVTSDGDNLVISGTVIIRPPYSQQHCDAPNEIILSRIRNILQSVS